MIYNIVYINMLNSNNRIYDLEACEKIIEDFKNKPICYGTIGYIDTPNITDISHIIEKMWIENNILKADIRILDTPSGEILKNMPKFRFFTQSHGIVQIDKKVNIMKFISLSAVDFKNWAYSKFELREEKLKRILNI